MKFIIILFLCGLLLLQIACGGGGGSSANNDPVTPPAPTVYTGVFLDSAVEGLHYMTTSGVGTTDSEGAFSYQANEQITFSIGDITFPAVSAQGIITPLDIFGVSEVDDTSVVNMARLLQSLDNDGDVDNGIKITTQAASAAVGLDIDFTAADFDQQVETLVANSGSVTTVLIDAQLATAHLQQTLNNIYANTDCGDDHAKVGASAQFSTLFHNVSGTAQVVDNCTIRIDMFYYDGGGPLVYFYAGTDHDYNASSAFPLGEAINGVLHENETITLKLPYGKTLDDFNTLSVWCAEFKASFGQLEWGQ